MGIPLLDRWYGGDVCVTPCTCHHVHDDVHPNTILSTPHADDLVAFFKRCHAGLKPGGVLFVKENVCKEGFEVDEDDSSVTRSHEYMLQLFKQADLRLLYSGLQKNFPPQLYKVRMYALQP